MTENEKPYLFEDKRKRNANENKRWKKGRNGSLLLLCEFEKTERGNKEITNGRQTIMTITTTRA